jgi:hypothetical protein
VLRELVESRFRAPNVRSAITALCAGLALAGCTSPSVVATNSTVGLAQPSPTTASYFKAPPAELPSTRTAAKHPVSTTPAAPVDRSVLAAPVEPDCEYKDPVSDPPSPEDIRIKLDYETQCHRQSEMILRTRLQQLQEAINGASAAPEAEPDCAFKGALSNPATAEQIRTKLQYQLQCYRQAESEVRVRIRQLQSSTTGRK